MLQTILEVRQHKTLEEPMRSKHLSKHAQNGEPTKN